MNILILHSDRDVLVNALAEAMQQVSSRVWVGTKGFQSGTRAVLITDDWGGCLGTRSCFVVVLSSKAQNIFIFKKTLFFF